MDGPVSKEASMGYEITCTCGQVLPVSEAMAGSSLSCPCGRTVPVPSLSELRQQDFPDSAPPSRAASPHSRLAEFQRTLTELTPRVYVTPLLVGVNVLLFV